MGGMSEANDSKVNLDVPEHLEYSDEHVWVDSSVEPAMVGVTEYATEQFGELVLQACVLGGGGLDDGGEVRVALGQAFDGGIVQAVGQALARVGAQGGEGVGQGHGVAPEKRGKPLLSGLTRRLTVVICAKFMDISSIRRDEAPHEAHRRRPAAALSAP